MLLSHQLQQMGIGPVCFSQIAVSRDLAGKLDELDLLSIISEKQHRMIPIWWESRASIE